MKKIIAILALSVLTAPFVLAQDLLQGNSFLDYYKDSPIRQQASISIKKLIDASIKEQKRKTAAEEELSCAKAAFFSSEKGHTKFIKVAFTNENGVKNYDICPGLALFDNLLDNYLVIPQQCGMKKFGYDILDKCGIVNLVYTEDTPKSFKKYEGEKAEFTSLESKDKMPKCKIEYKLLYNFVYDKQKGYPENEDLKGLLKYTYSTKDSLEVFFLSEEFFILDFGKGTFKEKSPEKITVKKGTRYI